MSNATPLVVEILKLEQRMIVIARERDRLGPGPQADGLEAQRVKLEERRRELLRTATDRELILIEYGRENVNGF